MTILNNKFWVSHFSMYKSVNIIERERERVPKALRESIKYQVTVTVIIFINGNIDRNSTAESVRKSVSSK